MLKKQDLVKLTAPIYRVPSEVLEYILWYSGPEELNGAYEPRSHRLEVMLTSHVCVWFRRVALSMPILWSAGINYSFDMGSEAPRYGMGERLALPYWPMPLEDLSGSCRDLGKHHP